MTLAGATTWPPDVSDHAVLRYLERVHGLDVELVRAAIGGATAQARGAAEAKLGPGLRFAVVIAEVRFVVDGGVVVTTLGRGQRLRPNIRSGRRGRHGRDVAGR